MDPNLHKLQPSIKHLVFYQTQAVTTFCICVKKSCCISGTRRIRNVSIAAAETNYKTKKMSHRTKPITLAGTHSNKPAQ